MPALAPPEAPPSDQREPVTKRWRAARIAARVAFAALLLGLVLRHSGVAPVLSAIALADRATLLLAIAMLPALVLLRTFRWSLLLRGQGVTVPWPVLLRALLLGVLVGQMFPTDVAGDATRVVATRRAGTATRIAVGAVLADRLLGIWALLASAVLGLLAGEASRRLGLPPWSWVPALTVLALGTGGVLLLGRSRRPAESMPDRRSWLWLRAAAGTARAFATRRSALLAAAALALLGKLMIAVQVALLARSLGAAMGVLDAMVVVPAAGLAAALPVSIGGIGLREAALSIAFVRYGEAPALGVALAWLLYGLRLLEGGLGALLTLAAAGDRRRRRVAPARSGPPGELGSAG